MCAVQKGVRLRRAVEPLLPALMRLRRARKVLLKQQLRVVRREPFLCMVLEVSPW